MGNPDAGSSDYQHRAEYELQPQEYQYEATHESVASHDQNQFQPLAQPNDPQAPPPPPPPPPPVAQLQQQQPTQYPPPQTNQAYGAQPARPVQFPPPSNQMQSNGLSQPGAYSQQGPQTVPVKPVQFPPLSAKNNQTYPNGLNQPGAFPPYGQQPMPVQQTPVSFPPPAPQASPGMQFQQQNGPQVQYGTMPTGGAVSGFPAQSQGTAWSSGLFDCMNDPMNALVTAFFPCLTFGQIAEIVDDGHTSCGTSGMLYGGIAFCIALPCILSCTYRTKLRNKFGLPEAPAPDWVTHFVCEWCALCQEHRELQARGWDPSIGWQGNIMRNQMQQADVMAAPMNQRMMA